MVDVLTKDPEDKCYTAQELRDKYGFTKSRREKFLGACAFSKPNPNFKEGDSKRKQMISYWTQAQVDKALEKVRQDWDLTEDYQWIYNPRWLKEKDAADFIEDIKYYSEHELRQKYFLVNANFTKFLGPCAVSKIQPNSRRKKPKWTRYWTEEQVDKALQSPNFQSYIEEKEHEAAKLAERQKANKLWQEQYKAKRKILEMREAEERRAQTLAVFTALLPSLETYLKEHHGIAKISVLMRHFDFTVSKVLVVSGFLKFLLKDDPRYFVGKYRNSNVIAFKPDFSEDEKIRLAEVKQLFSDYLELEEQRERERPEVKAAMEKLRASRAKRRAILEERKRQTELERLERQQREIELRERTRRLEIERGKIRDLLTRFDLESIIEQSKALTRHVTLHIGPTNSGKTWQSIQALKSAENGVYLGPLRLLALEMFDTLNNEGTPCSLLTGEEYEPVPFATVTASTIELCDYNAHYDISVIDEAQMIADPVRGCQWTKAILLANAKEIHVCLAPEAEKIICDLLKKSDTPYDIVRHDRLCPLTFNGKVSGLEEIQPGDALIVFSRKQVLALAGDLLFKCNLKSSVIYGALPPVSRRDEVSKFMNGETNVVIATDAIGMGISLPIKRVIFCATEKFDGETVRSLTTTEIKQIAGRAGRYGIYDKGEVLVMRANRSLVERRLKQDAPVINFLTIPFPVETLNSDFSISELLQVWKDMPKGKGYRREDVSEALFLYNRLSSALKGLDKDIVYRFITCPVDVKDESLINYWQQCCDAIVRKIEVPLPPFSEENLECCERKYKGYDIRHQILRRFGTEEPHLLEKLALCKKINDFLRQDKRQYRRKCSVCGKILPFNYQYGMCESCYNKRRSYYHSWYDFAY